MKRGRLLAGLGYALWGVLVFAVVFGVRVVEQRGEQAAQQGVRLGRGVSVSFCGPEFYAMPPRFAATGATVRLPACEVRLENIRGALSFADIFSGRMGLDASCEVAGGNVTVHAVNGECFDTGEFECEFDAARLNISAMPMVPEFLGLSGTVRVSGKVRGALDGSRLEGEGRAEAKSIGATLPLVALKDGRVRDGVVSGVWSVSGDVVKLSGVTARLGAADVELGGTIAVKRAHVERSRLKIDGRWRAEPEAVREEVVGARGLRLLRRGGVPLHVTGTFARPVVKS